MDCLVNKKSQQVITLKECENDLKTYEAIKTKTEFQNKKILELQS
jgi:hypothetical protein